MAQEQTNHFAEIVVAPEIEALLSLSESVSIVDRLLALSVPADIETRSNEWDRAVSQRLQGRIADSMRIMLEGAEERSAA